MMSTCQGQLSRSAVVNPDALLQLVNNLMSNTFALKLKLVVLVWPCLRIIKMRYIIYMQQQHIL